jgi:hypothetical protein
MPTHTDILRSFPSMRAALCRRYNWFIHVTPEQFVDRIREHGLLPNADADAPAEVKVELCMNKVAILTLHPLGAKRFPKGAASTLVLPLGEDEPKRVCLAIEANNLPNRLDLDCSYDWSNVERKLQSNTNKMDLDELFVHLVNDYGSVASYDPITSTAIRVFCRYNSPANPSSWKMLNAANDCDIATIDEGV